MRRKVIQIANSTQLISLPRKWAQKYGVMKGDELEVVEQANKIVVSTEKGLESSKVSVDVSKFNVRIVTWLIVALYKSGYDEVEIIFDNPGTAKLVQEMMNEVMGFVIIEQTNKRCVIRSLSKGVEGEFDATLRRNFLVVKSLAKSTLELIKEGHFENLADVAKLEKTNNQLTSFCHRMLNKRGFKDPGKTSYMYVLIKQLEGIADHYRDICNHFAGPEHKNYKPGKNVLKLFDEANEVLDAYYHLFYNFDDGKIIELTTQRKKLTQDGYKLLKTQNISEIFLIINLLGVVEKISDSMGSYLGLHY